MGKCEHEPQHAANWNIPVAEKGATLRLLCMGYLGIKYLAGPENSAETFGRVERGEFEATVGDPSF